MLHTALSKNPEKVAIVYEQQTWTYAEVDRLTTYLACNLITAGVAAGDRVALHMQNRPELAFAFLACLKAGCIAVPVNTRLKGPEIDYILRHSGAAYYLGEPDLYAALEKSCPAIANLEARYITDSTSSNGVLSFNDLLRPANAALPAIGSGQPAAILYTSGTTAHPKGVTHSHRSLAAMANCMIDVHLDDAQIVLVMSSMAHMIGLGLLFFSGLFNGATVVITRPMEFAKNLEAFARQRCTFSLALPVMCEGLMRAQAEANLDVSSGRYFYAGGDSLSPAVKQGFEAGLVPLLEAYGATEIAPICWNVPEASCSGSLGLPAIGAQIRLIDANGNDSVDGEAGELCVRAPHVMTGYWRDPDATAAAIRDSWFHTGDLAWRDSNGFYHFAGRKKEIIIRGGSNVSPQEVEAVLYDHPAVAEVGVIGCPDAHWGETVAAYIVLRPGCAATEPELIAFARERLADYKTPEKIFFLDQLPKSPSGKVQRRALREAERAAILSPSI